ncbi:MAG TPA: hypothetical protein VKG23_04850 [Thermoanaerobaculia bacterium]|nr:hypothetical protein [Thermoanaerobaculia bacterium]
MTVAALVLAAAAAAAPPPPPVNFPGAAEAKDPTSRYAVVEAAPGANASAHGKHALLLKTVATGQTRPLLTFSRAATVFWSPDGSALAVTDRRSADASTVLLFFPDRPGETDLDGALQKALGPLPERTGNEHVFLEVVRWLDAKRLRLRLHGYGARDREGFSELFDYDLGGNFKRAIF